MSFSNLIISVAGFPYFFVGTFIEAHAQLHGAQKQLDFPTFS